MEVRPTSLPGCVEVVLRPSQDRRGSFLKLFSAAELATAGLDLAAAEVFVSRSVRGVVRGLHFQRPPADVAKLVTCLEGEIVDAVVDLRPGSPTRGEHCVVPLSQAAANAVYVPEGCAHGFLATSDEALVAYVQSGAHAPDLEGGVLWSSAGIDWPLDALAGQPVVLSDRDAGFPTLAEVLAEADTGTIGAG